MIKLLEILEITGNPKAIIMAGGGGAGKSFILKQLNLNLKVYNPDKYVEGEGMPLITASNLVEKEIQEAINNKESFVWDTTAGNPSKIENIVQAGYDVAMIMVYTHPIVSLISNFERSDRAMPLQAVLSTWRNTYSLVDTYKQMLGDRFYLILNTRIDQFKQDIDSFNAAAKQGSKGIQKFIKDLISQNPEKYKSTFSKPFDFKSEQESQAYEKEVQRLDFNREDESMVKNLKKHFDSFWQKGKLPPSGSMQKKVAAIERDRIRSKEQAEEVASDISRMLYDTNFQQLLDDSETVQNVKSNLQSFLK
jgi:predicted kinase